MAWADKGPAHYAHISPQRYEIALAYGMNAIESDLLKYLLRWRYKHDDPMLDLDKVVDCAEKLRAYVRESGRDGP